jgi:hypothetical protein
VEDACSFARARACAKSDTKRALQQGGFKEIVYHPDQLPATRRSTGPLAGLAVIEYDGPDA